MGDKGKNIRPGNKIIVIGETEFNVVIPTTLEEGEKIFIDTGAPPILRLGQEVGLWETVIAGPYKVPHVSDTPMNLVNSGAAGGQHLQVARPDGSDPQIIYSHQAIKLAPVI